jgi:hypothetical protein
MKRPAKVFFQIGGQMSSAFVLFPSMQETPWGSFDLFTGKREEMVHCSPDRLSPFRGPINDDTIVYLYDNRMFGLPLPEFSRAAANPLDAVHAVVEGGNPLDGIRIQKD